VKGESCKHSFVAKTIVYKRCKLTIAGITKMEIPLYNKDLKYTHQNKILSAAAFTNYGCQNCALIWSLGFRLCLC
jgi:hypothetical protein